MPGRSDVTAEGGRAGQVVVEHVMEDLKLEAECVHLSQEDHRLADAQSVHSPGVKHNCATRRFVIYNGVSYRSSDMLSRSHHTNKYKLHYFNFCLTVPVDFSEVCFSNNI